MGIVVTELPFLIGPEKVIEKIKDGVNNKKLVGISDVTDLTDRTNGLRLVIELKTGFDPQVVLDLLYRYTPMEDSFGINNVTLVNGRPNTLGLRDLLGVYLAHRITVTRRRSKNRLGKREARLHLVDGLLVAILSIDEVIQTTPVASLDFLPSGKLPSSSIGILNSLQMRAFIEEAKSRYDFVFFDSPPIMGVSDASILASEVDMAILVVQYRKYPQQMTLRAKQMVEKVGGRLLGVVLNNINISQDSYYYYYSGYYYDYYSKNDESKPAEEAGEKTKSNA
jgi:capsular exopolysaccharide synthesis family protein